MTKRRKLSVERGRAKLNYIIDSIKHGTSVGASRLSRNEQRQLDRGLDTLASGTRRLDQARKRMRTNQRAQDGWHYIKNQGRKALKLKPLPKPRSRKRVS